MKQDKPASHLLSVLALTGACALWGTSFASMKICGEILNRAAAPVDVNESFGLVLFTAFRFTLATLLTLLVWPASRCALRPAEWPPLLRVALPMAAGFILQAAGLPYTTATISGFITGMCVCFTPLAEWALLGKRPTWPLAAAIGLALLGAALITFKKGGALSIGPGEILTLLCVLAYSVQIVYTGVSADRIGPGPLTVYSFGVVALAAWAVAAVMAPTALVRALWLAAHDGRFWMFFLLVLLFATLGAQMLMNTYQRYVRPSEASVLYTSEPLFAGIFGVLFIGWIEFPGPVGLVGALLMLAANFVVAWKPAGGPHVTPPPTAAGDGGAGR
jgi:drug/metabolite transporter (DMT)-like permease